jgi:hopanoid-associated phosphorylase
MDRKRPIGVLTGLASEARLADALSRQQGGESPPPRIACAAASRARARACAQKLVDQGVAALLSFGIAGGLDPAFPTGTVILGEAVLTSLGARLDCHTAWREAVQEAAASAGLALQSAALAGAAEVISSPADKAQLFAANGAAAVDMESHAVAQVAAAAGLPFLALRAIADPANRALPAAALAPLTLEGKPQPLLVAARLALRPWDLPEVLRLGLDARKAERALAGLRPLAPALFGGF